MLVKKTNMGELWIRGNKRPNAQHELVLQYGWSLIV